MWFVGAYKKNESTTVICKQTVLKGGWYLKEIIRELISIVLKRKEYRHINSWNIIHTYLPVELICYNCQKKNDSKPNGNKKNIKNEGYRCAKKCEGSYASNKSCRDGVRKSMCPCVASGTGCLELCRSVNCGNIFQARIATESPAIKENDKGS